ncbi:MAG: sulfur carrier protein ThiS [Pseudomonadota bacterium]
MQLRINGKEETVTEVQSITDLLKIRGVETPETVSVKLNGEILKREKLGTTILKENDEIEFLYFVSGGIASEITG